MLAQGLRLVQLRRSVQVSSEEKKASEVRQDLLVVDSSAFKSMAFSLEPTFLVSGRLTLLSGDNRRTEAPGLLSGGLS
jgi:hypothetical protein